MADIEIGQMNLLTLQIDLTDVSMHLLNCVPYYIRQRRKWVDQAMKDLLLMIYVICSSCGEPYSSI